MLGSGMVLEGRKKPGEQNNPRSAASSIMTIIIFDRTVAFELDQHCLSFDKLTSLVSIGDKAAALMVSRRLTWLAETFLSE